MNRVCLIGRLTKDPESKTTSSGIAIANFTIAVDRDFKAADGQKETDFIPVVAWRQAAEFVSKYVGKGRLVSVDGKLQVRSWNAQDGSRRTVTEVIADSVRALDKGNQNSAAAEPERRYEAPAQKQEDDVDPFADPD